MREVEVKAILVNRDVTLRKLQELGCVLGEPVIQKDTVYIPKGAVMPVESYTNVLRIREQQGKYILTLKQPVTNQLDCIERELEILDAQAMADIIEYLGFFKVSYVEKYRQKCKYQHYEICLDEVKDLGSFIEVEKMVEDSEADGVQGELLTFLETLGVSKNNQVFDGYDVLMHKKLSTGA
jgi:adenylate cyclase, class 2